MPRYEGLDAYQGRRVRAVFSGGRVEGVLEAIVHLDQDDVLTIGRRPYRLAKIQELYLLGEEGTFRVWPPLSPGESVNEPPSEPKLLYDPALYAVAVGLVGRTVKVEAGLTDLVGVLEAVSSRLDPAGPQLHISVGDRVPVTVLPLGIVTDLAEFSGGALPKLGAEELERDIIPAIMVGYPFDGRAAQQKPLAEVAAQVLRVSGEYGEPLAETFERACSYYGLAAVSRQSLQALLARLTTETLTEVETPTGADAGGPAPAEIEAPAGRKKSSKKVSTEGQ